MPVELVAGLVVRSRDEELVWKRHPVTVNAFHVDLPERTETLDVEFQFLTLPDGWKLSCALDATGGGATRTFGPVPLDILIDSPVLAGRHFRRVALDADVHLTLVADEAHQIALTPERISPHARVVEQADRLFGARHSTGSRCCWR